MAPTFPIFLGVILYCFLVFVSLIIYVSSLFFKSKRSIGKKFLYTAIISFPCLVVMGFVCLLVYAVPALLFLWLKNNNYLSGTPQIIITLIGLFIFTISVAVSGLYLWYLASNIFCYREDDKPIDGFIESPLVLKFLRPSLRKLLL